MATMGSFDGVHAGHRELLRQVTELAREKGVESVVMTFDPHPRFVLGTGEGLQMLSTIEEKAYLLEQMGIDSLVVIPFTKQFSLLSPKEFIEQMVLQMGIGTLVVPWLSDYLYLNNRIKACVHSAVIGAIAIYVFFLLDPTVM